jgi:hypothetical protein
MKFLQIVMALFSTESSFRPAKFEQNDRVLGKSAHIKLVYHKIINYEVK